MLDLVLLKTLRSLRLLNYAFASPLMIAGFKFFCSHAVMLLCFHAPKIRVDIVSIFPPHYSTNPR